MTKLEKPRKTAVLLLAHGSPEKVADVPDFLRRVTGGRQLSEEVIAEVKHRYSAIGCSPLTKITLEQGELLAAQLGMRVYVGMRNWHPLISEVLGEMTRDGVQQAVVICMAPHNSRTSVGLYRNSLRGAPKGLIFDFVECWHDQPLLIQAFAEKLVAGRKRALAEAGFPIPVIFTAHSVPHRTILEGDPYESQSKRTAELVAKAVGLKTSDWRMAFQSQGMSMGPWLGPTLEDTIIEFGRMGFRGVFIQPIGFLCDHVEVLYDIDIVAKRRADENSIRVWRAESLNGAPLLISALTEVVRARLNLAAGR